MKEILMIAAKSIMGTSPHGGDGRKQGPRHLNYPVQHAANNIYLGSSEWAAK